jgi:hypothetical protein
MPSRLLLFMVVLLYDLAAILRSGTLSPPIAPGLTRG